MSVPRELHQRVIESNVWLALDNIEPGTPYPLLAQRGLERVRVNERAARRVHKHARLLHLLQKRSVYDVMCRGPAGREYEYDVAPRCELVERYAPYAVQPELLRDLSVTRGVRMRGRARGVEAVFVAKRHESREYRLRYAPEADKACGTTWCRPRRTQLRAAEGERRPACGRPLRDANTLDGCLCWEKCDAHQTGIDHPHRLFHVTTSH